MKKTSTSSIRYVTGYASRASRPVKSLTLVAALATIGWASNAHALGLGQLRVHSALGQPLRAEVELTKAQAASLKAGMAAPAVYSQRGLQYSSTVKGIRSSLQKRKGRNVLVLSSNAPINEPFVDIVVQASDRTGKVTRDFSILLDPPSYVKAPAPVVQPAAPQSPVTTSTASGITQRKVLTLPPLEGEQSVAQAQPSGKKRAVKKRRRRVASARARAGKVRVRRGFTASQIAARNRPRGVSLDQMLVALVQANPHAFIKGNVNLMHSGVVLRMPSKQEVQAISAQEASQIVRAHSNDFSNYRGRLASIPAAQMAPSAQQSAGRVQTQVEDKKVVTTPSADKLEISKQKTEAQKTQAATEKKVAESLQKKENVARADELKRNLEDLKDISASAETAKKEAAKKEPAKPAEEASKPAPTVAPEVEAKVPSTETATAPTTDASATATDGMQVTPDGETPTDAAPATDVMVTETEPKKPETPAKKPEPKKKPTPPPAPVAEEPGFLEGLMDNPLALGGGALAIVAALGYVFVRRRKQNEDHDDGASSFLESGLNPDSFFHASGGKEVDTSESSSMGQSTNLNQSSMLYSPSQLDAEADVDPVSEADVYLAYGRDIQAEEILKDALAKQPDRIPVHAKLLEIYARRRDTKAYAHTATELKRLTNATGAEWDSACAKGAEIDPGNPLYGAAAAATAGVAMAAASEPAVEEPTPSAIPEPEVKIEPSVQPEAAAEPVAQSALSPATMPVNAEEKKSEPVDLSLSMPDTASSGAVQETDAAIDTNQVDFDMSGLSLDVADGADAAADTADDAMATKLALAREFLDIGDRDGARAMAQEVVQNASGDLKDQAQSLLNDLS